VESERVLGSDVPVIVKKPSRQVLIVEDDFVVGSELADVLTEQGLTVIGPVADGVAALKIARDVPLAVAIVDLNLAGEINGLTVARHLVEKFGVRIVFVSGQISDVVREGMDLTRHFISKPYNDEAVISAVRELIDAGPADMQSSSVGHTH
jgi:DNA-binding NarL/FixJ family response regulator